MSDVKRVRWGILSTARIGVDQVIPAIQESSCAEVVAIASRDASRAETVASALNIPDHYGSYEELLAADNVDAVYNPLPNHLHVSWSIRALEAGRHVLCEKPIAPTLEEGQQLVDAGRRHPELKLMEAFMYRHSLQWQRARDMVRGGAIGDLRTIQTFFSFFNDDPGNIRNNPEWGGGAMLDIGCYPISLSRFIWGAEPKRVVATVEFDPRFQVDRLNSVILEFEGGTSTFSCSTQLADHQRVNIHGTGGRIELEIPFNAPKDRPCRMWHQEGTDIREVELEVCNQYLAQNDLFCEAVLSGGDVPTPIEDAVSNMRVIEAVWESGRTGQWIGLD